MRKAGGNRPRPVPQAEAKKLHKQGRHARLANRPGPTSLIQDEQGKPVGALGIARDVSEQKQAEMRPRESEELFRQLAENIREVLFVTSPEPAQVIYVSPAYEEVTGKPREELYRRATAWMDGIPEEDRVHVVSTFRRAQRGEKTDMEYRLVRPDGSVRWIRTRTYPVRDERGRFSRVVGLAEDITERKQAEAKLRDSEELLRQVTDDIREVFFATTPDPVRVIYVSPAYDEIWGRPREELRQRPEAWIDSIHEDDRERAREVLRRSRRGEKTDMEFRIVRPDGSLRWIRNRTYPVHDEMGRFTRVVGFAEDISERKTAEVELRETHQKLNLALEEMRERTRASEKLTELVDLIQGCRSDQQAYKISEDALASIFESCDGALCLTSPSRDIVEAVALWGTSPATERAFSPGDCWALRRGKTHVVKSASSSMRCEHVHASLSGGHICVPLAAQGETLGLLHVQYRLAPDGQGELSDGRAIPRLVEQAELVGERVSLALANLKLREILRHQSVRDPLTGLFNRRYMEETLDRELSRAARRNESVAVAMCDLDRFKEFNDTFGHEAGDLVLREVASILRLKVRQGDIACRFGGEEFVLILPEATSEIAAERAEAIRKEIESLAIPFRGHTLGRITISIGIAMFPDDGATAEELFRASDRSLYQAKTEGRDRIVFSQASRL